MIAPLASSAVHTTARALSIFPPKPEKGNESRWLFLLRRDVETVPRAATPSATARRTGRGAKYTVDEAARRHAACPDEETQDTGVAYARFPPSEPTPYRDGLLPS
ncbi:MAG: hypothetical protein WBB74_01175 [Gaiellaceae bacterium]